MRRVLLVTLTAAGISLASGAALVSTAAVAQTPPAAPAPAAPPSAQVQPAADQPGGDRMGMYRGGMEHRGPGMGGMRGPEGMMRMRMGRMMHRMRQFALVYPAADRNLSGADVQKIAEAFLLFNGNHTWKVADVKEDGDRVTFELTTADGGEIARFAMDRHTGRPERIS